MEITKLKYSEKPIRRASRAYWWNRVGLSFLITLILLVGILVYRIANDEHAWVVSALSAAALFNLVVMFVSYILNLKQSLSLFRAMNVPEATLEMEEEYFCITSDVGESKTDWALIKEIWCFDDVWFLVFPRGAFMVLPVSDLTQESKSFITSKVEGKDLREHLRIWIRAGFTISALILVAPIIYFAPLSSFWAAIYSVVVGVILLGGLWWGLKQNVTKRRSGR